MTLLWTLVLERLSFPICRVRGLELKLHGLLFPSFTHHHSQRGWSCLPRSTGGFILPPQSRSCSGLLGTRVIIPVFVCVFLLDQPRGLSSLPVPLQTYLFSSVEPDSIKDSAEQETKKRSIPATQLVLPAGPGLGSFRLHSRRGLPGNSPRPGYPLLCLFG